MKYSDGLRMPRQIIILSLALIVFGCLSFRSLARNVTLPSVSTSVTITNNSSRAINNVYSADLQGRNWSSDLLAQSSIASGQSANVDVGCDTQQIKLIAEDADGCFASYVITCGSNASWTITNDTARDCGSQ
jgi:hypothetical protein